MCINLSGYVVKNIVDNCGLSYLWLNQSMMDTNHAKQLIHMIIKEVALHNWYTDISTSLMCTMYRLFKKQLNFEDYLLSCNNREQISLTKYRCANSKVPVYNQIYMYETELCTLCDLNVNSNEYHYIRICPYYRQSRELYLKHYFYTRLIKKLLSSRIYIEEYLSAFVEVLCQLIFFCADMPVLLCYKVYMFIHKYT